MISTGEWVGFGVAVTAAMVLVTAMLVARATAGGCHPAVMRRRLLTIWGCVLGAVATGVAARTFIGGYAVDFDIRNVHFVISTSRLWVALAAVVVIGGLMAVAVWQVRLLTLGPLCQPGSHNSEHD